MCNGWNHQDGCDCGFGPPYSYIRVVDFRIPSERAARKTSVGGRFHISIPIEGMPRPDDLNDELRQALIRSLEAPLREIAKKNMLAVSPTAQLQARITRLAAGSLEVYFKIIFIGGGALFTFFVKYADFKKGVFLFRDDIVKQSRHIIKAVKNATQANAKGKSKLVTLDLSKALHVKEESTEIRDNSE